MRRISFGGCRLTDQNWAADICYDILAEPVETGSVLFCEDYGVRIELIPASGTIEVAELRGITPSWRVIEQFADKLYRNRVTPAAARDVLEDYLAAL